MANPFYVQPGNNLAPAMSGLQQTMARVGEQKRAREATEADKQEFAERYEAAMKAYSSNDPDQVAAVSLQYPGIADQLDKSVTYRNKKTKQNYLRSMYAVLEDPSEGNVERIVANRQKFLRSQGATPEETRETDTFIERFRQDPEKMQKQMELELARRDPVRWQLFSKARDGKPPVKQLSEIEKIEYWQKMPEGQAKDAFGRKEKYLAEAGDSGQKEGPSTAEDRFVRDNMPMWRVNNPGATEVEAGKARGDFRLEHKRAQAAEVTSVTQAKEKVLTEFAQPKAYRTEVGKAMAQIEKNTELIHSKGELTPEEKKSNARIGMTNKLAKLAGYYAELDAIGGIVNVDNTTAENIWAAAQSMELGQYIGKVYGSDAQSIRHAIQGIIPQLMMDIRKATDMTSKAIDSEKELEFYKQAMSNEKKDIQSNIAAMILLDEEYGDGTIAQELRKMDVAPRYLEELKAEATLIANGALLSDVERTKRIRSGRRPRKTSLQSAGAPEITSQQQYDGLAPGAQYTEDGVLYRKPGGN